MKKSGILLFICTQLFSTNILYGQTLKDASDYFLRGQMDSAVAIAKKFINPDKSVAEAYLIAGRGLVGQDKYEEATTYLEKVKKIDDAPAWAKAWAMRDLGLCYYSIGNYAKSKENILKCIESNATNNATSAAKNSAILFGFDKLYNSWLTKETKHFAFHFQDTSGIGNISKFMQNREAAFDTINNFLQAKLPKKIDYFVWNDTEQADKLFRQQLAFSKTDFCITHTEPEHTLGHEIAHHISRYVSPSVKPNQLIAEGVCVYFDFSNRDNISLLHEVIDSPETNFSIIDIWKNEPKTDDAVIYPLGGELVRRLIENFGREKFIRLLADQSYDNAKKIYGGGLDKLINTLEKDIKQ